MFPELRGETRGTNRRRGYELLEGMAFFGAEGVASLTTWLAVNGTYLNRFETFAAIDGAIIVTFLLRNFGPSGTRRDSTNQGSASIKIPTD